jgi:hypothetical protein
MQCDKNRGDTEGCHIRHGVDLQSEIGLLLRPFSAPGDEAVEQVAEPGVHETYDACPKRSAGGEDNRENTQSNTRQSQARCQIEMPQNDPPERIARASSERLT